MSIQETIQRVAAQVGVSIASARKGGSWKSAKLVAFREGVIAAHPDAHPRELSDALNIDRSSVYVIRDRIRRKQLFVNSVNSDRATLTHAAATLQ